MRLFMVALTMLITTSAHASVIFEDNFDSHADWSPTQGGGSDSEHCSTGDCSIPSRYDGWRQNGTSVPGGHNSLNINGANKRGASGKALTIYSESVGDWTNDALLDLKLADENNGYNELYVRFWIKFQPGWQWAKSGIVGQKFLHMSHFDQALGSTRYDFFSASQNKPRDVFLLYKYGGGCSDVASDSMVSVLQNPPTSNSQSREMIKYFPPGGTYASCPNEANGTDFWDKSWPMSPNGGGMMGDGQWHLWEFYVKINSADGKADGISRFYQDGVLVNNITDATWVSGADPFSRRWNYLWLGGNSANDFNPGHEQWYAIDDLTVYTPMQSGDAKCSGQCGADGRLPLNYAIGGGTSAAAPAP